jgi:release factor glutamine methyltransferase
MTNINNANGAVKYDDIHEAGIAHILGLDLIVGPEVFIPKPSGIFLIQEADVYIKKNGGNLKVADFGAGTGFLSIALKRANPNINVTAFEKSSQAYEYLLKNIEKYEYDITPVRMDVINNEINDFDLIVSNTPFLSNINRAKMKDPLLSLDGGADGLVALNNFIDAAAKSLKPGGYLIIAHLKSQTEDVALKLENDFTIEKNIDHPLMTAHGEMSQSFTYCIRK